MKVLSLFLLGTLAFGCAPSAAHNPPGTGGGGGGEDGGAVGGGGSDGGGGGGPQPGQMTELLDDFSNDSDALPTLGTPPRVGYWYTYHDMSMTGMLTFPTGMSFTPAMGGPMGTGYSARIAGTGFTTWGAGFGVDLNDPGAMRAPYDAGNYVGLTLWAKAGTATKVRMNLPNKDTDTMGGVCMGMACNDHFGADLDIGTDWKQFTILFSDLKQAGWSMVAVPSFDAHSIYGLQFQVSSMPFDVWVTDIYLIKK
jgi:hypothetical protein